MKDRQPTKVLSNGAIRYGIYNADGSLNHYEYMKREDAPSVEGTPLNKASLLSDATAQKVWPNADTRPADPTVNQALNKLAGGTAAIGDIMMTTRDIDSASWLLCNGQYITEEQYPELFNTLRVSASAAPWSTELLPATSGTSTEATLSYANGYWFYSVDAHLYYSPDLISWTDITPSDLAKYGDTALKITQFFSMHYNQGVYVCAAQVSTLNDTKYMCLYSDQLQHTGWKLSYILTKPQYGSSVVYEPCTKLIIAEGTYYFSYYAYAGSYYGTDYNEWHYVYHTTTLTETISETSWTESNNVSSNIYPVLYDAVSKYFYGNKYQYVGSGTFQGISRTRTLLSANAWSDLTLPSAAADVTGYAVAANDIAIATFSSSKSQIYRSTDMGMSYVSLLSTELQNKHFGEVCLLSGILCAWAGNGDKNIYMFNADNTDVQTVVSDVPIQGVFAHSTNVIAICSSDLTQIVHQDFTHSKKKLPNISPDSRSKAYIKALEE